MAVLSPNVAIRVYLYKETQGQLSPFELYPRNDEGGEYFSLEEIIINEDMFSSTVSGYLSFVDSSNILDQWNLSSDSSWIRLILDGKVHDFKISEIKTQSNLAQKIIHGPSGSPIKTTISFVSDEFLWKNFQIIVDDFIGKISKVEGSESTVDPVLNQYLEDIKVPTEILDKERGFVQFIMSQASNKTKKPLEAHETFNDIWIKNAFTFYPYLKDANNLRISQLMNYICEYACYKKNKNAANFFFWEDLDKWNFKCIEGLMEDAQEDLMNPDSENIKTYRPHLNEFAEDALFSMEIINDIDTNYILDSGAAFSTYDRVKPDWKNPYRGFVDVMKSFIVKTINYNYTLDFRKWYDISGKKADDKTSIFVNRIDFIQDATGVPKYTTNENNEIIIDPTSIGGDGSETPHGYTGDKLLAFNNYTFNALTDNIFGFYSAPYNTKQISSWQIKSFNHTTEKEYWQSQFDFCELPGSILSVVNDIKNSAKIYGEEYINLKNKKTIWDVYRKKMCCERSIPSNFFAIITGAEKIYGSTGSTEFSKEDSSGIWAYSWVEVELWPQEKGEGGINKITKMLDAGKQIIEFETEGADSSDFPFIFVQSPWALQGKISEEKKINVIKQTGTTDTASGNEIKEVTINTKDNRAYNLNEILNSRIPDAFETDGSIKSVIMNPGISTILGDYDAEKTAYPKKSQMLPVGKFRVISGNCPDFLHDGETPDGNEKGFYYAGRVVQMSAIPKETIQSIILPGVNDMASTGFVAQTKDDEEEPYRVERDYLFLFDTENAHDGFCADCTGG